MQDVLVQLDSSFDQRSGYILVAWLRHRDAQVTIGEPLAIIQDGETRKVISAPCSGRIVAIYADPGAPLLPRNLIALIRPGLPLALPVNDGNSIIVAVAVIALIIIIVPMLNGMTNITAITASATPIATNTAARWWPFADTPQPSTIARQATTTPGPDQTPTQTILADANATAVPESTPATATTPATDAQPSPQPSVLMVKQISALINEMINLTNEIRPWVQTNHAINPQINEQMIQPRFVRNQAIIDRLHTIAQQNATNTTLSPIEQQLISQIDQFISPCMTVYTNVQTAITNNTVPPTLSDQYVQCNNGSGNLVQFLVEQ